MSYGDIVRLNRMYKCGPSYMSSMPENIQKLADKVPSPKAETNQHYNGSVPINKEPVPASINKPSSNRTIFGVLIFKSIE